MLFTSVLKSKPDTDIRAAVGLDPSGRIVLDGKDYAIEPDEILYMGSNRTKIWRRIGIRKKLIQKARRIEGQSQSQWSQHACYTKKVYAAD